MQTGYISIIIGLSILVVCLIIEIQRLKKEIETLYDKLANNQIMNMKSVDLSDKSSKCDIYHDLIKNRYYPRFNRNRIFQSKNGLTHNPEQARGDDNGQYSTTLEGAQKFLDEYIISLNRPKFKIIPYASTSTG